MDFLSKEAMKYTFMSRDAINAKIAGDFGGVLKTMILPSQMQQFADAYLEKNGRVKQTPMNTNRFLFIQVNLTILITCQGGGAYNIHTLLDVCGIYGITIASCSNGSICSV